MHDRSPLRRLAAWIIGLVVTVGALATLWAGLGIYELTLVRAAMWGNAPADVYDVFDVAPAVLSLLQLCLMIAAGVCWMMWQYQAAARCVPGSLRISPALHGWGWAIPLAWWVVPLMTVHDLGRVTRRVPWHLLVPWWVTWLGAVLIGNVTTLVTATVDDVGVYALTLAAGVASALMLAVSAGFAAVIVRRLTDALDPPAAPSR